MLKLIAFLCLLAFALADTTVERSQVGGRIVGGSSAPISSYPHQVSLRYLGQHVCGGSIIGDHWVLTAAKCINGAISDYSVLAGTNNAASGGNLYGINNYTKHGRYNANSFDYDIAVINVTSNFIFSSNVTKVNITSTSPSSGATAVVTGWGSTAEGGAFVSGLQYVQLPIVSNSDCNKVYGSGSVTDRMICAGYTSGSRGACVGDAGGPLLVGGVQVGIVSWGTGCARPNYPGVYTNVANLRSWITSITGAASLPRISPYLLFISVVLLSDLLHFGALDSILYSLSIS